MAHRVPVETLGFYPTDAQLEDTDVASNRALHLVLEGQEQMACQFLLANSITAVLEGALGRVADMQNRTGIRAHNLLATAQSGALPHLLDGRAVAGAAALCCTAANACAAMDDCGSAADYALIGQRLIDTSLRDIALGAADLLETNRLSVQCALSLGSAAWLSVAPQSTPQARQRSGSPRRTTGLHGHSVRRWMAAADAFEQGAVSAGSVSQADPHARMLLSPLPPWAHAALMFASAGVAYSIAAQTMLDGAAARPMPPDSAPSALLSPSKAASSPEEPWAAARQAQHALQQAATFASSSLAVFTSPAVPSGDAGGELPPQLALAADVAMRVAATTVCCLGTADNMLCRAPRRALSIFTGLVRDLSRAGAARHAVVLGAAGIALAAPAAAARLAALLRAQQTAQFATAEASAKEGVAVVGVADPPSPASTSASPASSTEGAIGGAMRTHAGGQPTEHDTPAGFAGVRASATAKRSSQRKQAGDRSPATSMRPALPRALWSIHTQDLFGALASSLLTLGYSRIVAELSLIWGERHLHGAASEQAVAPGRAIGAEGALCDPLTTHTLLDALLEPHCALEHCMHVHTLQACLHGTPYMLDFAMSLRLSHFLEPPAGAQRQQPQRPWSTEAAWGSFLSESVQRARAQLPATGALCVSAVPGATVTSAQWLPRPAQEQYHPLPQHQPVDVPPSSPNASRGGVQGGAFHSPPTGGRSRRAGRRRVSSAVQPPPQLTQAYMSVHDTLQMHIDVEADGVAAALLGGGAAAGVLEVCAMQCQSGERLQLPKPAVLGASGQQATISISGSAVAGLQHAASAVFVGVWLQLAGMCWLAHMPAPLTAHLVQPQPVFTPSTTHELDASPCMRLSLDVQCFDSAELQVAGVAAALCSPWQAQGLLEADTPLAPECRVGCEVRHTGDDAAAAPLLQADELKAMAVAVVGEGDVQLLLPVALVASRAAQLQAGVGDELRLVCWVWRGATAGSSAPHMCRRLVLPVPVPAAAGAWQSNQGPWDPDEQARVRFWRQALCLDVQREGVGRLDVALTCSASLVPGALLEALAAPQAGSAACDTASCQLSLQTVPAGFVWVGHQVLRLRSLHGPAQLGTALQTPSQQAHNEGSMAWLADLKYVGSGKTYTTRVRLEAAVAVADA